MYTFKDFNVKYEEAVLSNGVRVLLLRRSNAPICMDVSFAGGSHLDPKGKEGLAHFAEHMILMGTESFPTKDRLAVNIENIGGSIGARISSEFLAVRAEVVDKGDLKTATTMLNEVFNKALFENSAVEKERTSILGEIKDIRSSPSKYIWDVFKNICFQKTDYEKFPAGTEESVSSIKREDLISFYEKSFTSGYASIVVSGDISMSNLVKTLEETLNIRHSEEFHFGDQPPSFRDRKIDIVEYTNQEQVHLAIGFRTVPVNHSDLVSLDVIAEILGSGRASILKKRLRYERGLVYNVSAVSKGFARGGLFCVKTSTSKSHLQEVLNIITDEFRNIREGKIYKEDLDFVKNRIIKSQRRMMQTSGSWVGSHVFNYTVRNNITVPDEINAIEGVTLGDLQRVGEKYFKKDSWYLALCGDVKQDGISVGY